MSKKTTVISQEALQQQMDSFEMPGKRGLFSKKPDGKLPILEFLEQKNQSCYLCNKRAYNMRRYYHTFFHLIKDADFRSKVEGCKGFCMHHFQELLEHAQEKLPNNQIQWFYTTVFNLMEDNLARVQGDLDWFIEKFDYRYKDEDWKNSKDAIPRGIQKLVGGYVQDPPFKEK